jgi:hypothetical protein
MSRGATRERPYQGNWPILYNRSVSEMVLTAAKNYSLATFPSGKQYKCDLSARYNIGTRAWAQTLKLTRRNDSPWDDGKSSSSKWRTPVPLSALWHREAEGLSSEETSDIYTPRPTTATSGASSRVSLRSVVGSLFLVC